MALSRNDLLQYDSKGVKKITLKELITDSNPEGEAYVRLWTGEEQQELADMEERTPADKMYVHYLIRSICDSEGVSLFTKDDLKALNKKPARVLIALATEAYKHNVLNNEAIEEEAKN